MAPPQLPLTAKLLLQAHGARSLRLLVAWLLARGLLLPVLVHQLAATRRRQDS